MITQSRPCRVSRKWVHPTLLPLLLFLIAGASSADALASREHPARVSDLVGSGAYEPAGDVDWDELTPNLPIFAGDRIFSHADSRAEVELGRDNFLRIADKTDVVFTELSDGRTGLQVHQGDLIVRLTRPDRFLVKTPVSSIELQKSGLYRIQVDENGATRVLVRKGRAQVESQRGRQKVQSGEQLVIDDAQAGVQPAGELVLDDFDLWSDRKDAEVVRPHSVSYDDIGHYPGAYDLDRYGHWANYHPHGRVWVPRVSVGWGPFRLGRWGYLSVGWTWLSHEPWGWLPYHYGRWVYYEPHHHWAWVPGGFNHWYPARVNFYFGGGYVGWAPWGHYGGRGRNVVINQTFINRWNPRNPGNGLNVLRERDFGRGSRLDRRVTPTRAIAGRFREGLPNQLSNPVREGRNVRVRGGAARSALASRSRSVNSIRAGTVQTAVPSRRGVTSSRTIFSGTTTSRAGRVGSTSPRVFRGGESQPGRASTTSRRGGPNIIKVAPSRPTANRSSARSGAGSRASAGRQTGVTSSAPRVQPERGSTGGSLGQRPEGRSTRNSSLSSGPRIYRTPSNPRQSKPRFGRSRSTSRSNPSVSRSGGRSLQRSRRSTYGSTSRTVPRSSIRSSIGRPSRSAPRPSVQRPSRSSPSRGSSGRSSSRSRRR